MPLLFRALRFLPIFLTLISVLPHDARALCQDYFSYEWNEPLDMNSPVDGPLENVPNLEKRSVGAFNYAGGVVSFNATGPNSLVTFLAGLPFVPANNQNGAVPVGSRYGESIPIPSSAYRYFVVRMYSSANTTGEVHWGLNHTRLAAASFPVSAGWHTYEIDMNAVTVVPLAGSNLSWSAANWEIFQFSPGITNGLSFQIDYARLYTDPSCDSVSSPALTYIQPDKRGGRDFAQAVLGNSWNMNAVGDVAQAFNYSSAQFLPNNSFTDSAGRIATGDFFRVDNKTGNDDPAMHLISAAPAAKRIDPLEYKILCFGLNNKTDGSGYNSVARVIYHDPSLSNAQGPYRIGDDILVSRGMHDYCMDLSSTIDSRTEPAQPAGSPSPWTAIASHGVGVDELRIDPNEVSEEPFFGYLDYVHLRTDHQANTQYGIAVQAAVTDTVDLYYFSENGGGESYIGQLPAGRATNVYKWNTSGVAAGKYRVTSRIARGGNTFFQKAPGRIDIGHGRTQDQTPPVLVCERPGDNYSFDNALEIAGYALDETRLGTVEMTVDGIYVKSLTPDRFHLAGRNAYPTYADSNKAGFQQLIDMSALGRGVHTVVLKAFDTAGNETSCSYDVTSRPGSNTPLLSYPANNADPLAFSPVDPGGGGGGGGGSARPTIKVKYLAKSTVSYTIGGTGACSAVTLQAGSDNKLSNAVTLLSNATGASIAAISTGVPTFSKPRRSREDGILFLMASCSTGEQSKKVKLSALKTKNKKRMKSEKKLLGFLSTHTQLGG